MAIVKARSSIKPVAPLWCELDDAAQMSASNLRRLLDNLATAVVVIDRHLRLQDLNPAAEALLSVSRRQALGQKVDAVLPENAHLPAALRRVFEGSGSFTERDMPLRLGDGRSLVVDCTMTPLVEGGRLRETLVEMTNVDRLHRIVREESMIAQNTVATALVRGMAHEIKNPLGGIRGAAQLLERELGDSRLTEYTRIIVGEVDRLRQLIDRMLEPASKAAPAPVNVHEVLEHVRGLVLVETGGEPPIDVDYDPSLPPVSAVRDHLVQVFLNVLRNAVEAAGTAGHVRLRTRIQRLVTIGARLHRLALRVDVIDDGPGVPPAIAGTIFYPMVSGRADGTGLGLAIAQSLVQRAGGLIEFESRPGATTFTVYLPLDHGH